MALSNVLQSFYDSLKVNAEEIELRHACDSSVNGCNYALDFHCKPVNETACPPPTICTKQRLVKSINFDMCTETLGCENGAMCSSYELEAACLRRRKKKPPSSSVMEVSKQKRYPPPLTTLSGERRLILWSKREEGRLVIFSYKPSAIETERSGGRLVLRFH